MKDMIRKWLVEQVGADEADLEIIYGDYLSSFDESLEKARGEIAAGDFAALNETAHTLKGATSAVGDEETYAAVLVLRDAAKASDLAAARRAFDTLVATRAAF